MLPLLLIVGKTKKQRTGGVQTRIVNYARNLKKMGIRPVLLDFGKPSPASFYHNVKFYHLAKSVSAAHLAKLNRVILDEKIRALHVLENITGRCQIAAMKLARQQKIKTGLSVYGGETMTIKKSWPPDLINRWRLQNALRIADVIAVNSKVTAGIIPARWQDKVGYVYPGVNQNLLKYKKTDTTPDYGPGPRIFFAGRLHRRKGVDDLIKAAAILQKRYPDIRVKIAGLGVTGKIYEKESKRLGLTQKYSRSGELYQALAAKLGLAANVEIIGEVKSLEKLAAFYQWGDIFCMPSKITRPTSGFESFGCVYLEASLFKKPSVGTDHYGIRESIVNGQTGLLARENDPEDLARNLEKLIINKKLARQLGQAGYRRTLEQFKDADSAAQLASLYIGASLAKT